MTSLGKLMVEFPLPPGLTRALLRSAALGCEEVMLPVAAMLSVENIFIRPGSHFHVRMFLLQSLHVFGLKYISYFFSNFVHLRRSRKT